MTQSLEFIAGGGEAGFLMRSLDWSASPLGPPDGWPQALRTVAGVLLQSRFPMFVAWGKFVKIAVGDTGHGMPPEVQARAFEPFFTTKDVSKGSGLGLPQVYGFAQQSRGRVSIESTVDVGTIVTVLLPRSLRDPAGAGTADAPAAAPKTDGVRRGHVLLVEDDRDVSALTREMLSSLGFSVTHASSASAALGALANSRSIDVVLSDIMMPGGVSGVQLAREIRRRQPHLPILLTTGYLEAASGLENGEFELLLKPFSLEALAAVLSVPATTDADVT